MTVYECQLSDISCHWIDTPVNVGRKSGDSYLNYPKTAQYRGKKQQNSPLDTIQHLDITA